MSNASSQLIEVYCEDCEVQYVVNARMEGYDEDGASWIIEDSDHDLNHGGHDVSI